VEFKVVGLQTGVGLGVAKHQMVSDILLFVCII
jgi:hypothetical protein